MPLRIKDLRGVKLAVRGTREHEFANLRRFTQQSKPLAKRLHYGFPWKPCFFSRSDNGP
jgi:hypothetical protein